MFCDGRLHLSRLGSRARRIERGAWEARLGEGAAGAPSSKTAKQWAREGATCVVSLLRATEPRFQATREACEAERLQWRHAPLSGKGAVTHPVAQDLLSWGHLREFLPCLLADGEHVVVHCAAGMHRTGGAAFAALRWSGMSASEALGFMEEMRAVTHAELLKVEKCGRPLWTIVEALLCTDLNGVSFSLSL